MIIPFVLPVRVLVSILIATFAGVTSSPAHRAVAPGCDASLWTHVYNPARLVQVKKCITATGTIRESNADDDGDQHMLLELDKGQNGLLNKRNMKKKGGDLVIEIVCANPVKLKKVKGACAGYRNSIAIPSVGTRVSVTGTYVVDGHNGWTEIHPVSEIHPIR